MSGGAKRADLADQIRARGEAARERDPVALRARDLLRRISAGEVDVPLVRRRVGAVVVAELAVVQSSLGASNAARGTTRDLRSPDASISSNSFGNVGHSGAAPALVADVRHATQLALELRLVEIVRIPEMQLRRRPLGRGDLHRPIPAARRRGVAS
jgi:hypothetical protein